MVLKQCMKIRGWIFPLMEFENRVNIVNADFGSEGVLDSGDGAGQGL